MQILRFFISVPALAIRNQTIYGCSIFLTDQWGGSRVSWISWHLVPGAGQGTSQVVLQNLVPGRCLRSWKRKVFAVSRTSRSRARAHGDGMGSASVFSTCGTTNEAMGMGGGSTHLMAILIFTGTPGCTISIHIHYAIDIVLICFDMSCLGLGAAL